MFSILVGLPFVILFQMFCFFIVTSIFSFVFYHISKAVIDVKIKKMNKFFEKSQLNANIINTRDKNNDRLFDEVIPIANIIIFIIWLFQFISYTYFDTDLASSYIAPLFPYKYEEFIVVLVWSSLLYNVSSFFYFVLRDSGVLPLKTRFLNLFISYKNISKSFNLKQFSNINFVITNLKDIEFISSLQYKFLNVNLIISSGLEIVLDINPLINLSLEIQAKSHVTLNNVKQIKSIH